MMNSIMLFTLLYPCLATVAALLPAWSPGVAWLVSFAFYQGARAPGY